MLGRIRTAIYNTLGCVEQTVGSIRIVGRPPFVAQAAEALAAIRGSEHRAVLEQSCLVRDDHFRTELRTFRQRPVIIARQACHASVAELAGFLAGQLFRRIAGSTNSILPDDLETAADDVELDVCWKACEELDFEKSSVIYWPVHQRLETAWAERAAHRDRLRHRQVVHRRCGWLAPLVRHGAIRRRSVLGITLRGTRRFLAATEWALQRLERTTALRFVQTHVRRIDEARFQEYRACIECRHRGGQVYVDWRQMRREPADYYAAVLVHEATHMELYRRDGGNYRQNFATPAEAYWREEAACDSRAYQTLLELESTESVRTQFRVRLEEQCKARDMTRHLTLRDRAVALAEDERYAEAVAVFDESLALGPWCTWQLLTWRAFSFEQMGKCADAITDLNEAIAIRSDDADIYAQRGRVYYKLGDLPAALADLQNALQIEPADPSLLSLQERVQNELQQAGTGQAEPELAVAAENAAIALNASLCCVEAKTASGS